MATDWVRLFDKRLCDLILSLTPVALPDFVQRNLTGLGEFSRFRSGFERSTDASHRVALLRTQGVSLEAMKEDLVEHLCLSPNRISLDYWACFSEVFRSIIPPSSISSLQLFPHLNEERYLLLNANDVSRMLASLELRRGEVTAMSEKAIAQLAEWRNLCSHDPGWMVAYFFDI